MKEKGRATEAKRRGSKRKSAPQKETPQLLDTVEALFEIPGKRNLRMNSNPQGIAAQHGGKKAPIKSLPRDVVPDELAKAEPRDFVVCPIVLSTEVAGAFSIGADSMRSLEPLIDAVSLLLEDVPENITGDKKLRVARDLLRNTKIQCGELWDRLEELAEHWDGQAVGVSNIVTASLAKGQTA